MRPVPPSLLALIIPVWLAGCMVGPDYRKPEMAPPAAFLEPMPWQLAAPRDHLPKGTWWTIYHDPVLDRLEAQAAAASPTLQAALARRDQARAIARVRRSPLFPDVSVNASGARSRVPPDAVRGTPAVTGDQLRLPLDLSYELDLWGRVRRLAEGAAAFAEAGEADYQNVLLSLQAEVARTYFLLRALEAERALVARTLATRRESLAIVEQRFNLGATDELDVHLARTELATAESEVLAIEQDHAMLRHALAVLCGQPPEVFQLEPSAAALASAPVIPVGLPADLVERRPDVAAAERRLAAANAEIGVAQAAFFPSITLGASAGYESSTVDTLTRWDQRLWAFGTGVSLPIFQGGRNAANFRRAQAVHAEALAAYRLAVLEALREVETGLSDLRLLAERRAVLERAVASSLQAAELVFARYEAGQVGYLDVTDAERTAIFNERLAVQLRGQQLVASVALVRALGGGW